MILRVENDIEKAILAVTHREQRVSSKRQVLHLTARLDTLQVLSPVSRIVKD